MDVAPLYRALFEEGRRFVYRMKDDVDPHDPDGGRVVGEAVLDCLIRDVSWQAHAVSSTLTCEVRGEEAALVLPNGEHHFLLTSRGLAMSPTPLAGGSLDEPALLPAAPVSGSASRDASASASPTVAPCVALVEADGDAVCSDVRCDVATGYGPTRDRRCFSPERGLETWLRENLEGPRVVRWALVGGS